ncbi:hypothetical protein GCM10018962_57520 [Dactylosporangium matsuzakiense]
MPAMALMPAARERSEATIVTARAGLSMVSRASSVPTVSITAAMPGGDSGAQARAVRDRLRARPAQEAEVALTGGTHDGNALETGLLQDADAHRSGGPVHEDRLAGGRAHHVQGLRGGGAGQQQVGRGREVEGAGLREDVLRRDGDPGGVAAGDAEGQHGVADRAAAGGDLGAGAHGAQDAGDLVADPQRQLTVGAAVG